MELRDYQQEIVSKVRRAQTNDLVQLDTGAGKTPIEAVLARDAKHCIIIAHRNVLITQISEKLAAIGVEHELVCSKTTRKRCIAIHRRKFGRDYVRDDLTSPIVASIDSLLSRATRNRLSIDTTLEWTLIVDEAHHVIQQNKWGALRELFYRARFIGFTATPCRYDGESLCSRDGGIFDRLIMAECLGANSTAELIRRGYLSGYRLYASPEKPELSDIEQFEGRSTRSKMLAVAGKPFDKYIEIASGRQCLAIVPSIRNAEELRDEFRSKGIPASLVHSELASHDIAAAFDDFEERLIRVLFAVDMVSEGFDLPNIEALMLCNFTRSFGRYRQWVGRALRPAQNKTAIIIDLCGNVIEHGLPDDPVNWDLEKPPKSGGALRSAPCTKCWFVYSVSLSTCPECGARNALHLRQNIGGYYVHLRARVDSSLIEAARRETARREEDERYSKEVVWPYFGGGGSLVSVTVMKIRKWFVDQLMSSGTPIRSINDFLRSQEASDTGFWMKHFTAFDLGTNDRRKCDRVFAKWEESRSSADEPKRTAVQRI